jgi:hypothetical protein
MLLYKVQYLILLVSEFGHLYLRLVVFETKVGVRSGMVFVTLLPKS